jgi:phage baseplate assembly protein W
MNMNIRYPFQYDERGRTARPASDDAHIRDMIEQLLFTSPGERVNRPDFGVGLQQMVFAPNSPEIAAVTQVSVQASLQRWLGDIIDVRDVGVESEESTLRIRVDYVVRRSNVRQAFTFVKTGN